MIAAAEQLAEKIDGFGRDTRGKADAMLKSFGDSYGADRDAIAASVRKIMGNNQLDVPHSPESLFDSLGRDLKEIERARTDAGKQMVDLAY